MCPQVKALRPDLILDSSSGPSVQPSCVTHVKQIDKAWAQNARPWPLLQFHIVHSSRSKMLRPSCSIHFEQTRRLGNSLYYSSYFISSLFFLPRQVSFLLRVLLLQRQRREAIQNASQCVEGHRHDLTGLLHELLPKSDDCPNKMPIEFLFP